MAVAPLFIASMTVLKDALRLGGTVQAGGLAMIDQAVKDVRVRFYGRLTAARITTIKLANTVDAPATDAELLRALADSVEVRWVRLHLLRVMPALFMDGSGGRQQQWNDEGAFVARRQTDSEVERLEAELELDLAKLAGDDDLDEQQTINADVLEPDDEVDLPGATVWPGRRAEADD